MQVLEEVSSKKRRPPKYESNEHYPSIPRKLQRPQTRLFALNGPVTPNFEIKKQQSEQTLHPHDLKILIPS
jgi:hypothetical protein